MNMIIIEIDELIEPTGRNEGKKSLLANDEDKDRSETDKDDTILTQSRICLQSVQSTLSINLFLTSLPHTTCH